jgi:RimJ/RimL family protein N-acetyltransferase
MFNKKVIKPNRHLEWIEELSKSNFRKVFCVYSDRNVIGSMGYSLIESSDKSCSWSFYLSEKSRELGLAPYLELSFLDYLFFKQNLKIIFADVLISNRVILNLHKKFGFEVVSHYESSNRPSSDCCRITLKQKSWVTHRISLIQKFSFIFGKFTIEIIEN